MNGSLERNQNGILASKQKPNRDLLSHVTEIFDIRFYSPVPIVFLQELVLVEEPVAC